jgi:hypothetical protein
MIMTNSENMGGILSAEYVIVDYVNRCAIVLNKINLSFTGNKNWVEFPATPNKIQVTVTPKPSNGKTLYDVNAVVFCPTPKLEKFSQLQSLEMRKILLRYTTANGETLVVGDKSNPLKVTIEKITPSQANGYSGTKFNMTCTMTHSELTIDL